MESPDLEYIRSEITKRLPRRVRWLVHETSIDFDFSKARKPLDTVKESDFIAGGSDKKWRVLFIFGEQDVSEGGGARPFLGVHKSTGKIYGLDVERDTSPIYLLNTDIDSFIATLRLFDAALRRHKGDVSALAAAARELDRAAYSRSDWRLLAEYLTQE